MPAATYPRVQDANQLQALRGVLEADGISERVCNEDASSVKQIEVFLFNLWGFTRLWVLHARDQVQALASSTRGRPDLPPSRLSTPEHTPGLVRETRLRGHVSGKPTTNSRSWLTGCLQSPPPTRLARSGLPLWRSTPPVTHGRLWNGQTCGI